MYYVFGSYSKLIKLVRLHICLFSRLLFENQISLYSGLPPFITQTKQGNLYNKHAPTNGILKPTEMAINTYNVLWGNFDT